MSKLRDKLLKSSTIEMTSMMSDSDIYNKKDFAATEIPMLNVAYSGDVNGGLMPGVTTFAGPSRHFKTLFCLISAVAYLRKYPDAIVLFYDSEFGTPPAYFKSAGISPDRVIHTPITSYETLKHDIAVQLDTIERGDKVVIIIDSLGNLASKKEAQDALDGKSVADMTRAKENKSLFRVITPYLRIKDIPLLVVQHTYDTMEMYSKKIVSGGQGTMLASDNVFIIGRQQDKDGAELQGYNFVINVEKSRYVKEKSKIPITVSFSGGIRRWSGILDLAVEGNYIIKATAQSYCRVDRETGEMIETVKYKRKDIEYNSELWKEVFATTDFAEFISKKYKVSYGDLITDESIDEEIDDVLDEE
jgi:hypothetical protein